MTDQSLKDRIVLVTGAGRGIGKAAALTYARAGATLLLLGKTQSALNETYDLIEAEELAQASARIAEGAFMEFTIREIE